MTWTLGSFNVGLETIFLIHSYVLKLHLFLAVGDITSTPQSNSPRSRRMRRRKSPESTKERRKRTRHLDQPVPIVTDLHRMQVFSDTKKTTVSIEREVRVVVTGHSGCNGFIGNENPYRR